MSVCSLVTGCTDGEVRLVGGNTRSEGRVEVCVSGQWGSVCNDQWDDYAAKTVCRELGYPIAGAVLYVQQYLVLLLVINYCV